jgi:RNA polymerase sigma factor (sigma-70 family)
VEIVAAANRPTSFNAEEFATWVQPHILKMRMLAMRMTSEDRADDVLQEALKRAWEKRHQFREDRGSGSGWLLAITADQARKSNRRPREGPIQVEPAGPVRDLDQAVDLQQALGRLSTRQRLAVDCYYYVGLSIATTAEAMHCSEGTVKSTLADARQRLRTILGHG